MKQIALILFIFTLSSMGFAAELKTLRSLKETKTLADSSMSDFAKGIIKEGFDRLRPYWNIPDSRVDLAAEKAEANIALFETTYGKTIGYEFIKREKIKDFFVRYSYAHKFEHHVMRWVFTFYKPKEGWEFSSVEFDNRANLLLE